MKCRLYGSLLRPAIAVVGVWDPFLSYHRDMLKDLHAYATKKSSSSLGVLIDPSPGKFSSFKMRYGVSGWPVYDSLQARVSFILGCGLDAVLCVRFRKRDFTATAAEFLDAVRASVLLDELWLGALQLLGPGDQGSAAAIADYAALHGIRVTILPPPPLATYDVRSFLASGRLADAIAVVGHPPIWQRPRSGTLRLAWRPGKYRAVPIERVDFILGQPDMEVTLSLRPKGPGALSWPSRSVRYLAFTMGPSDN